MTMYDDVGTFHAKFNLPERVAGDKPRQLTDEEFQYRMRFIQEELHEFVTAHHASDLVAMADALADLAWVVLGTAHFMKLPFDQVWDEVRRANMEKEIAVEGDVTHKRGRIEKIRKPAGWRPPQLQALLMITTEGED